MFTACEELFPGTRETRTVIIRIPHVRYYAITATSLTNPIKMRFCFYFFFFFSVYLSNINCSQMRPTRSHVCFRIINTSRVDKRGENVESELSTREFNLGLLLLSLFVIPRYNNIIIIFFTIITGNKRKVIMLNLTVEKQKLFN